MLVKDLIIALTMVSPDAVVVITNPYNDDVVEPKVVEIGYEFVEICIEEGWRLKL